MKPAHRKVFTGGSLFLFLILCFLSPSVISASNYAAANWELPRPDGQIIEYYQASAGNISILLFWASWCPFCRSLMPHLQELADEFQSQGVDFYALNIYEDGDPVAYFKKNNYSFILLLTADLVAEDYGVTGTPAVFVVNQDKQIIYKRRLGISDEDLKNNIKVLLNRLMDN